MSSSDSASRADWPRLVEIANQLRHRQPLRFRQRRSEHRRDEHFGRRAERAGKVVLEDAAARRRRTRLEHRPDACGGIRGAQAGQRFGDRRRMVRKVIVDRHAVGDCPTTSSRRLTPANRRKSFRGPLRANPHLRRDRDRGSGVAHVVRADERHLESAVRRSAAPDPESRRRRRRFEVVRLPVDARPPCRTSRRATWRRPPRPQRTLAVRAEEQQSASAGRGSTRRRNASVTASTSA